MDIEIPAELTAYLRAHRHVLADETPRMRVLAGGVSNRTVLVERTVSAASPASWVMKQALEKLRVAADWRSSPERIHREAAGMRALYEVAPSGSIPQLLFEDHEHHLLAMTAIAQPHENWKDLLLAGRIDDDLVDQFGRLLGEIHQRSHQRASELAPAFADRSFFDSLRIDPYYRTSAAACPEAAGFLALLIQESDGIRTALVHGDYSPKNILVREGRLVLLDHEVIHWGDPAFDLGFALAHLLSKAHHLRKDRARFAAAAVRFWMSYVRAAAAGADLQLQPRAVRHGLGCLLARVAGRSPLEYLDAVARARQRAAIVTLMASPPRTISELTTAFLAGISRAEGERSDRADD
ncbi:MAG: phosphotransferase [Planctomycetes bacterium]|nr:phosphotransferase [Planctomycetota bacterium]